MKHLIKIFALLLGFLPMLTAQGVYVDTDATAEDYERFIENYLKVDFRGKAIKSMGLTEDEIIAFDPLYNEYTQAKRALLQKKFDLTSKYKDEMAEDDTAKDEENETADFIENYWEIEIKEMELKKDFFDRFENIMSNEQAISFFILEESMRKRVDRPTLTKVVPMIVEFEILDAENDTGANTDGNESRTKDGKVWTKEQAMALSEKGKVSRSEAKETTDENEERIKDGVVRTKEQAMALSNKGQISDKTASKVETETEKWTDKESTTSENDSELPSKEEALALKQKDRLNKETKATKDNNDKVTAFSSWLEANKNGVALDHKYTHDGLDHLFNAVWNVADNQGIDVTAWNTQKEEITSMADQLRVDPSSTDHADITRKAFVMIAEMMIAVQENKETPGTKTAVKALHDAARAINPDKLMTDQATEIYAFFEQANKTMKKLSKPGDMKKSPNYDNK